MQRSPKALKSHPVSVAIYGDESADDGLVESVRESGVLVPLVVKDDNTVISGHRRLRAALACELASVPVTVVSFADERAERLAIIEHNRQREKTLSQRMREADEIEKIEKDRAKERLKTSTGGAKPRPTATLPEADKGEAREKVSAAVGMKPRTYDKARKVYEAAKAGDKKAQKALADVDAGKSTISKAEKDVTKAAKKTEKAKKTDNGFPAI